MSMRKTIVAGCVTAAAFIAPAAHAQDEYIGEAILTAASYCPLGTLPANGQLLDIKYYQALYSLLGTTYGGDGKSNFALPKIAPPVPGMRYCVVTQGIYPPQ